MNTDATRNTKYKPNVVDLLGDTRAYADPDCTDETGFLLARCYSVSELKEFLRNYERDEP
jgi:hypothetical protein